MAISYECNDIGVKNTWATKNIVQLSPKAGREPFKEYFFFSWIRVPATHSHFKLRTMSQVFRFFYAFKVKFKQIYSINYFYWKS